MSGRGAPVLAFIAVLAAAGGATAAPLRASSARAQCLVDPDQVIAKVRSTPCRGVENGAPVIELWTMGQGDLMVEKFGHAALCICREGERSYCYNYGTTDFSRPLSMGWGFLRGDSEFWVEPWPRERMLQWYMCKDRSLYLQVFDDTVMPADQRQRMADKLVSDTPDPREAGINYQYHHFYDNCTTRVRDIIDEGVQGRLREGTDEVVGPTYRQLGARGFAEQSWMRAMSDFVYGRESDKQPTAWQVMFHPDYLREAVAAKLGVPATPVWERQGRAFSQEGSTGRVWTFLFALLVALPAVLTRVRRKRQKLGLVLSIVPITFIAVVIWFLALASTLPEFRWNEALFLYLPSDVIIPWLSAPRRRRYGRVRVVMVAAVGLLTAVGVFHQPLWMPILVVLPTLLVAAYPEPDRAAAAAAGDVPVEAKPAEAKADKPAARKPGSKAARRMKRSARG